MDIDFSRGLGFQGLEFDEGNGYRTVEQGGEGARKKLFLSILEWDKDVQIGLTSRATIRAYDEPDANLHYSAQRKIFNAISDIVGNARANSQAIISTHSLTMVDRAPANAIIHLTPTDGVSSVETLHSDGDQEIADFLTRISIVGGIKNSSIFYEKCFLVVEGQSEEAAIPIIYKKLFGRTLFEDGIVLANLYTNSAWQGFLKLLKRNKAGCTILLLDTDTQAPASGAKITPTKLQEIGFNPQFLAINVFFAGVQEFEDIFPDRCIRDIFNKLYFKPGRAKWTLPEIGAIRATYSKISKGFEQESRNFIATHHNRYKKPDFARKSQIM